MFATKKIVFVSLLVSLALLPTAMIHLPTGIFRLGGFSIIASGYLLGPLWGGFVGGVVDILGFFIKPPGPFHIGFTVTSILTGIIPALLMRRLRPSYFNFAWTIGVGQLVTSVVMVGYIQHTIYGLPLVYYWGKGLVAQSLHILLYALLLKAICNSIEQLPSKGILNPCWEVKPRRQDNDNT